MDGLTIHRLARELDRTLRNSKIERIHQPGERDVVLTLRTQGQTHRLLLSAHKQSARVHLLGDAKPENPTEPPMFCMVLRKHLEAGRIVFVRQQGWDRTIEIGIEHFSELGDLVKYVLIAELMGRHANVMLCSTDEAHRPQRVVAAAVHVTDEMSRVRQIYPGAAYSPPPPQNKYAFSELPVDRLQGLDAQQATARSNQMELVRLVAGVGPITACEILHRAAAASESDFPGAVRLAMVDLFTAVMNDNESPSIQLDELGRPVACAPFWLSSVASARACDSMSEAIRLLFAHLTERMKTNQLAGELARAVEQHLDRLRGKLVKIRESELDSATHDQLRIFGELLTTYAHRVAKGESEVILPNFYADEQPLPIRLNPALSAIENAQRYFKQASKKKRSIAILARERAETEADLQYLEAVAAHLDGASPDNLREIQRELINEGFLKQKTRNKVKPGSGREPKQGRPDEYLSADGFVLRVGRNNLQNDRLTLRQSQPNDVWLHVKEVPGSHVVIRRDQRDIPDSTLNEAALLAVYFSKARDHAGVPVDYTEIRHIWKPAGARPGHVLYENYKTLYVTPDRTLIEPIVQRKL